ncbi:MAG: sensor histidine kinase [Nonlabens sp.]
MRKVVLVLCCISTLLLWSQNPLNTARENLKSAKNVQDSIKACQDIAWYIQRSYIDSSFYYNKIAQRLAERINDKDAINTNLKELAGYQYRSGDYNTAKTTYKKVQQAYEKLNDSLNVAKIHSNLGAVFQSASEPEKAMESYIEALRFFESDVKYLPITATTLSNLGVLYKSLGNIDKALNSYKKAEQIYESHPNPTSMANVKSNLGGLYVDMKDYENGKIYLESSRTLCLENNNFHTLAAVDQNLGVIATVEKNYDEALQYFEESLNIKTQLGDLNEAATSKVSIATIQTELGSYEDAVKNLKEAIAVFKENNNSERLLIAYPALNAAYIYMNEQDSAFVYLDKYTALREELARKDAVRVSTEMDAKYQTEKKDRELAEQRNKILEKELEVNQRNNMLWLLAIVLLAAIILGILFYRQQKFKNRQLKQEHELKEAKNQLDNQERLQQQRLRISRDLHDNIGSQLTFLISSLDNLKYARDISKEIANDKLDQLSVFARSTIVELRDTIWAMNKNDISVGDIKDRLQNYKTAAQNAGKEIDLDFKDSIDLKDSFNSVRGMHLFRIIQEAVNNSIKYSKTNEIQIDFSKSDSNLIVIIRDHGAGFDQAIARQGNGLKNMKERAKLMEGSVEITSAVGNGTKISIKIPVNK